MAGRHQRPNAPPQPPAAGVPRQNEYFLPRDGIDREVITADICRYLGPDALVRPGTYDVGAPVCPVALPGSPEDLLLILQLVS